MPNNSNNNTTYMDFTPPKLPFAWLATSFIAPVIIAILPNIISRKEISMEMQIIIGLVSLSIMLFVSCIMLTLKLYNTSYSQQLIELKIGMLEKKLTSF